MRLAVNAITLPPPLGSEDTAFVSGLLPHLQASDKDFEFVLLTSPENHDAFAPWDRVCVNGVNGPDALGLWPYTRNIERVVSEHKPDVLLTPLHCAPEKATVPVVLWSLGLRAWRQPASFLQRRQKAAQRRVRQACASAAAILAPNESTRRGLLDGFGAAMDRIAAVRFGVDPRIAETSQPCVEQPFLLCSGALATNGDILLEAHQSLLKEYPHTLVLVGRATEGEPADWGPNALRFERLPDSQLAGLYQHCAAFVYPASQDTAGFAIAEALSAGAVVVTSRTGGIAEVAGEAPLYFNAGSASSMLSMIRRALREESEQRQRRIRAGRAAIAGLTWEQCAAKTYQVLHRAARRQRTRR